MIRIILRSLSFMQSDDEDILFAQGSNEYPSTFRELIKRFRWQKRR